MSKQYRNRGWLVEKYHVEELTQYEMAELCNVSQSTIKTWMAKLNVRTLSPSEVAERDIGEQPYHDSEWLREMYYGEEMNLNEIADRCDVCRATIISWFDKHEIERRSSWEHARRDCAAFRTDSRGYEEWYSNEGGKRHHIRVHRLLAVAEYGFDTTVENVVHHRNGLKWDNRPSNIELQSPTQHGITHDKERHRNDRGQYV